MFVRKMTQCLLCGANQVWINVDSHYFVDVEASRNRSGEQSRTATDVQNLERLILVISGNNALIFAIFKNIP